MWFLLGVAVMLVAIIAARVWLDDKERRKWQAMLPWLLGAPPPETTIAITRQRTPQQPLPPTTNMRRVLATVPSSSAQAVVVVPAVAERTLSPQRENDIRTALLEKRMERFSMVLTEENQIVSLPSSQDAHQQEDASSTTTNPTMGNNKDNVEEDVEAQLSTTHDKNQQQANIMETQSANPPNNNGGHHNHYMSTTTATIMMIRVPRAGTKTTTTPTSNEPTVDDTTRTTDDSNKKNHCMDWRTHGPTCSICLAPMLAGDAVTWSSNVECTHVFHRTCMQGWCQSSSRRFVKRAWEQRVRAVASRPEPTLSDASTTTTDPMLQALLAAPMECPCCRQAFLLADPAGDEAVLQAIGTTGNVVDANRTNQQDTNETEP